MKRILTNPRTVLAGAIPLLIIFLLSSGCSATKAQENPSVSTPPDQQASALTGTVTLSGANALYPMAVLWAEQFQKVYPKVKIEVSGGGAGKGMTDVLGGLVDIGMVSRAIDPAETARGAYPVGVAKDAVVAVVNAQNPVLIEILAQGIKKSAFADIYVNQTVKTWGDVIGNPDVKDEIHVYTRSDASGAADIWALYIAGKKQDGLKGVGVFSDPGLVAAVQKDPLGIGYNNYSYAFDMKTGQPLNGVVVIPFDVNENGKADITEDIGTKAKTVDAIKNGAFPHPPARVEYFVTKGKPAGLTAEFIRWVLTDGQKFVDQGGYVELTKDDLTTELNKVR